MASFVKNFPRTSLLTRTNAALAMSSLAIAITALWSVLAFVTTPISERSAIDQGGLLVLSAQMWVELPAERRPNFEFELLVNHDLIISANVRDLPTVTEDNQYYDYLRREIQNRVGSSVEIMESDGLLWVNIPTLSGVVPQVGFSSQHREAQPFIVGVLILVIGSIIVFGTSFYIVRRIANPLVRVSESARSFRGTGDFMPLPEEGPRELVSLAVSFNNMARDVSALLSNRTTLLAGISHDLRTPLARMRLALELLPDEVDPTLRDRFERNLLAMDDLIGDALRFARGAQEKSERTDFVKFTEEIVHSIDESITVEFEQDGCVELPGGAYSRVVTNLVNNARRHAAGTIVRGLLVDEELHLHVLDEGPGIPEEERERVFQPFYRLERSRSTSTGGSGLGLAIVAQLCLAHGWVVNLNNRHVGGTDAHLIIPVGPASMLE